MNVITTTELWPGVLYQIDTQWALITRRELLIKIGNYAFDDYLGIIWYSVESAE